MRSGLLPLCERSRKRRLRRYVVCPSPYKWLMRTAACVGRRRTRRLWLGFNFGDEHELLGLRFPRRFRYSRQHASLIAAATTSAATTAQSATATAHASGAAAGNSACATSSNSACAAAGNATRATSGDTTCAASTTARTAGAVRSAVRLLARRAARPRRGAYSGFRDRRAGATLRRRRQRREGNPAC